MSMGSMNQVERVALHLTSIITILKNMKDPEQLADLEEHFISLRDSQGCSDEELHMALDYLAQFAYRKAEAALFSGGE